MTYALNKVSGVVADIAPQVIEHPDFKDILTVVPEDYVEETPVVDVTPVSDKKNNKTDNTGETI
jgi:tRNA (Thr-GGU) A37 N-methylase